MHRAHAGQFGRQRGQPLAVDVAHQHRCPGAVEHLRHFQAQPIGAGGDEYLFSGEIHFLEHALVSWILMLKRLSII